MEQTHGSRKASKFASEDVISSTPDVVLTNMLNRLPLQDAELIFDEDFYKYLQKIEKEKDYGRIIDMFLRHHKGSITKFHLYIEKGCNSILDVDHIENWILILSQKGILDFTLLNMEAAPLKLTNHLFSCLKLKHLELYNCHFCANSSFAGFPDLLSLDLSEVKFGSYTCGEFVSRCPSLEILKLRDNTISEINRADIAKLENLKVLILPLYELDNMSMMTNSDILQLIDYFPDLQELNLDFWDCTVLADAVKRVQTTLPSLNTLRLYEIDFSNAGMLSCVVDLICSFPNLKTLLIKAQYKDYVPASAFSSLEVDFSRMGKLQLREVKFVYVIYTMNEVCLMKSLLASSPLLKKMSINPNLSKVFGGDYGKRNFIAELELHRASPIAEIIVD